jgi:DNA-binding NarL/FixJ family response regulator
LIRVLIADDHPVVRQGLRTFLGVHDGHVLFAPEAAQAVLGAETPAGDDRAPAALTHREREVLAQIALGRSNREIARVLVVSEKTIKGHVSNILMKLGLADRTQAALPAVRHGIVEDERTLLTRSTSITV